MQNIFIDILPPWVETGLQPAFYDLESGTVLQQTARMYAKVRELTEAFNHFSEDVSNEINNFEHETNTEIERFENATNDEIERFEGVVNDTVEEYIGKFNELHDYVEDYFDNLDVQKEINNKLDDMLKDGTLQEIITTYIQSNVTWTFDTVSEMQSATNLISGSFAQTLGYHTINDGGGARYYISDSGTPDGGSCIAVGSLFAHIVIENDSVNVKQFGAYGDSTHDDSSSFNNAITYLKNKYSVDNLFKYNLALHVPSGKYRIGEQIQLPIVVKMVIDGDVMMLSDVDDDSTIWINSGNISKTNVSSNITNLQAYNTMPTIGGDGVLCIERNTNDPQADVNDLTAESIAIEIGDRSYVATNVNCARNTYNNIAICGFATGIRINQINTYLINFENVLLERNRFNVVYGITGVSRWNSGENIKFNNCTFATSYNAFTVNSAGDPDFTFNSCSFDFNGNVFLIKYSSHLVVNAPHFEGVGYTQAGVINTTVDNCTGYGTIVYANYTPSDYTKVALVEINNPDYYLGSSTQILIPRFQSSSTATYPGLYVYHNSHQFYVEGGYNYNNIYMNTPNVVISGFNTDVSNSLMPCVPFNKNDESGKLDNIDNALNTLETLNTNYKFSTTNIAGVSVDTTDKIFNKSLKFTVSSQEWENLNRTFTLGDAKKITLTAFIKSQLTGDSDTWAKFGVTVRAYFYNSETGNIASGTTPVITYNDPHIFKDPNSDWLAIKPCVIDVPTGSNRVLISLGLANKKSNGVNIASSGYVLLGGMIVDTL